MEARKRWQDRLNMALGIWLFVSPLILVEPYAPFQLNLVTGHSFLMGLAIVIVAGYQPQEAQS